MIILVATSKGFDRYGFKTTYHWQCTDRDASGQRPALTKDSFMGLLAGVNDVELDLSILELGLIYDVAVVGRHVDLVMTLTSRHCPLAGKMMDHIKTAVFSDGTVDSVTLKLTFDPPWTVERLSPQLRDRLFGFGGVSGGRTLVMEKDPS